MKLSDDVTLAQYLSHRRIPLDAPAFRYEVISRVLERCAFPDLDPVETTVGQLVARIDAFDSEMHAMEGGDEVKSWSLHWQHCLPAFGLPSDATERDFVAAYRAVYEQAKAHGYASVSAMVEAGQATERQIAATELKAAELKAELASLERQAVVRAAGRLLDQHDAVLPPATKMSLLRLADSEGMEAMLGTLEALLADPSVRNSPYARVMAPKSINEAHTVASLPEVLHAQGLAALASTSASEPMTYAQKHALIKEIGPAEYRRMKGSK